MIKRPFVIREDGTDWLFQDNTFRMIRIPDDAKYVLIRIELQHLIWDVIATSQYHSELSDYSLKFQEDNPNSKLRIVPILVNV